MKRSGKILISLGTIIIIAQLLLIDYQDLSWSVNAGSYLSILSMVLVIFSIFLSKDDERN